MRKEPEEPKAKVQTATVTRPQQAGGASAAPPQAHNTPISPKDEKKGDVGGVIELPFDKQRPPAKLPLDLLAKNPEGQRYF